MKEYEVLYILHPATPEKEIADLGDRFTQLIQNHQGKVFFVRNWGRKTLAYPIMKQKDGIYIHIDFTGSKEVIAELERNLRINERVLRFLSVVLADNVDVAKREQELQEQLARSAEQTLTTEAVAESR